MNDTLKLSEELAAGSARLRIDVHGGEPREHVLDDMSFMNYRLADVRISPEVTLDEPDIVWRQDGDKAIAYDGRRMTFTGPWPAGPIQKVVVTMLALRMEAAGLHPFHSSAVRYQDRTILFMGGESNHGKSMGQIEACRRGALLVSTETTVIAPGANLDWSAGLHAPILAALRARDVDGAVDALGRHFAEVSANMATRLEDR